MSDRKITLERHPADRLKNGPPHLEVSRSLPFYMRNCNTYVHRVRFMRIHLTRDRVYSHTSVRFWCGGSGFMARGARLSATVPPARVVCATCEGRAIGAGHAGTPVINGNPVKFSPRKAG